MDVTKASAPRAKRKPQNTFKGPVSSRSVAFDILQTVLRQKQPFDETMERNEDLRKLEGRDRGFVHLLVATVLRRLGQLDEIILSCLEKPLEIRPKPLDLLRLGAAQILFLQTPPHAAVDTMVDLASHDNATAPFKGLINAVLRRVTREGAEKLKQQDITKLNIPAWLWLSWRQSYGVATARAISEACLGEALIDVSVKSDPAAWVDKLEARLLPTGSLRLTGEDPIPSLPGFNEGEWWVQDAAAALPALLFGDVTGKDIVDLCAAPGGKTAQLAARGARVTAVDRSDKRLERLKENMTRLGFTVAVVCKDAASYAPMEKFPLVLLDAPCSSTGTIRRHPDVLRLKRQDDVTRLAELQRKILFHAVEHVLAPGGTLVYSVCSLQPEEGPAQIENLLAQNPSIRRAPIQAEEIGREQILITPEGDLRCLPSQWADCGGIDGFYAARLIKAL